ncbi:MAG: response regulator transcription factor [Edaphobacter sp.]
MSHKIIIADTHSVFRAGVARILAIENDFCIVAQCDSGQRLIRAMETSPGSTAIFASTLGLDLPALIRTAKHFNSHTLAILENDEDAQSYLKQGVHGIIYRDVSNHDLIRCLHRVGRGETFAQRRSEESSASSENDLVGKRTRDRLTAKELAIIGLIVRGYKNKEIADELDNSEQVIKNYLRSIFDKTGVSDRLELALFVIHHHILAEAAAGAEFERPMKSVGQTRMRLAG